MKPEQQTKALAELDGWMEITPSKAAGIYLGLRKESHGPNQTLCIIPTYLTSYDAIIPLIQKQPDDVQWATFTQLSLIVSSDGPACLGTPDQYSEALLRATDKWKPVKSALPTVKSITQTTVAVAAVCAAI